MSALRRAAVCLALVCPLAAGAPHAKAHPSPSPMVDKINEVRRAHGLATLHYSPSLGRSSSKFSRRLLRTGRFTHAARIMTSSRFSSLGEILARTRGWSIRRRQTLRYWLGSPRHRSVLLSGSFRHVGAGRARGHFGSTRAVVWTIQLGR